MRFKLIIYIPLVLFGCKKQVNFPQTKIIGHAASGLDNPSSVFHDNSREAVEMALETSGCDGVEIDLQLSASGTLWLFHDPYLSEQTDETGCIGTKPDTELDKICYKTWHKEKLLPISKLNLDRFKGKTLMLDLRHYNYCQSQIVDVQPVIDQLNAIPQFHDGSIEVMVLLNTTDWALPFANQPYDMIYCAEKFEDAQAALAVLPFDGVIVRNSEISKDQTATLRSTGKKVIIFEVRSPKGIRSAFRKHPDYLVTDDLRATIIEKY